MQHDFPAELEERIGTGYAPVCIGLDPRLEALPRALLPDAAPCERILAFYERVLPVLAPTTPVVKPNIAFFEVHGTAGWRCYEAVCAEARAAGMLVIGDVKRGDIGSTAELYAQAHFRHADALTLQPYLGSDSIEPFLKRCRGEGKGVFVLVRTSNPGARDVQDLHVAEGSLAEAVAKLVHRWGLDLGKHDRYSPVGAVVGATWPRELHTLRTLMPRAWLLLPGVGAQGAKAADVAPAFDARGMGALVNQSRGVLQCFEPDDPAWLDRVRAAVGRFADDVRVASRR